MNNLIKTAFVIALGCIVSLSAATEQPVGPVLVPTTGEITLTPEQLKDLLAAASGQKQEQPVDASLASYVMYPFKLAGNGIVAGCKRFITDAAYTVFKVTLASGAVVTLVAIGMHTDPAATKFALGAAGLGLVLVASRDVRALIDGVKYALWI